MPANLNTLEYRVWRPIDELQYPSLNLEMKSQLAMADYHFRVNAAAIGIEPRTITTQILWTGRAECRITLVSVAAKDALARAWEPAAKLTGLRTERVATEI